MRAVDTLKIAQASDPRAAIQEAVSKHIDGIGVMRNRVLVGTYVEPEMTTGGILRPPKSVDEARYQGKVGLILKKGPAAFKFSDKMDTDHPTPEPEVGQWVMYRAADTWEVSLSGISCRFIHDDLIVATVEDPTAIY